MGQKYDRKFKKQIIYSPEQLEDIRRTNRRRAKDMERRVTRFLNAQRTPMSGAGMIKADGIGQLATGGIYLIECKLSAKIDIKLGPKVAFQYGWIPKLRQDVTAMRGLGARFGVFVIHWHGYNDDLVFVDLQYVPALEELTNRRLCDTIPTLNGGTRKDGAIRKAVNLYRDTFEALPALFLWHTDALYVTTLKEFKTLITQEGNNGDHVT